ncbi:MAG TPA: glycosyltransferase [Patescibacteria group bacterium]
MTSPKVALVYDWATTPYGGAEQVLTSLHHIFPDAPLFTSIYCQKKAQWAKIFNVKTSFLQHFPLAKRYFRAYGLLMPLAFETLDLTKYDVIISITSSFAKSVITQPHQLHVCYLLTPNRHLYSHRFEYEKKTPLPLNHLLTQVLSYLKYHDQVAAQRPDVIIPISQLIANRTKEYYRRTSNPIIYPPVDTPLSNQASDRRHQAQKYYLVISRLVPYKRIDLALKACQKLGRRLVIVGTGQELKRLKKLAQSSLHQSTVEFLENVSDRQLARLYLRAQALLMPGLEDFGITALEAVAHGVPVIVHRGSGAAEIIRHGREGIHLPKSSLAELVKAMHTLEMTAWDPVIMSRHVKKYSNEHFQKEFRTTISSLWEQWQKGELV